MHFHRAADGRGRRFGQPEVMHLAGANQFAHRPDGFLDGHLRVNPVLVVEINIIHTQPPQAGVAARADIFGPAIHAEKIPPLVAHVAKFRGQDHLVTAVFDGAPDQPLVFAAAVHVRRVEQGHADVQRAVNGGDGFLVIARAVKFRHPHASETERRDCQSLFSKLSLFHVISFRCAKSDSICIKISAAQNTFCVFYVFRGRARGRFPAGLAGREKGRLIFIRRPW